jgi:uncharacterized protein (DUF1800 family)
MPESAVSSPVKADWRAPLVAGALDAYVPSADKPWNAQRVAHVYRRLGFGATVQQIQQGLSMTPGELIDQLLDTAANLGTPDPPYWSAYTYDDYAADPDQIFVHRAELVRRWMGEMIDEGIRAKFSLFWHNHFVTELDVYDCNNYLWDYFSMIHEYAFGNFRTFTREMGKNAAMLVYLNGNLNIADEPNENYARELMELFTMGESNGYTQVDIVNMARALTGWQAQMYECGVPYYNPALHDNGSKTIFGQTQNFTFTNAHNLIFSARAEQTSRFIAGKIYKYFVYNKADNAVIEEMATTFKNNNWELLPMLKQLFKSEHFFDDKLFNAHLRDPLESMLPILKSAGVSSTQVTNTDWWDAMRYWSYQLGQDLFNPPNVAGWKGHRTWINESTLTTRWTYSAYVSYFLTQEEPMREQLRQLAITLTNDSNNPAVITAALIQHFTGQNLEPVYLQAAIIYFKAGIPENYFQDGSWNLYWDEAPYQIVNMLYFLVRLPEFQLT